VVVRRTRRVSPSSNSIIKVVSEAWTVTVWWAWARPRETRWPATKTTPGGGDAPLPAVVDHLEQARADVLAFTAFQK
jgi:hypothetical protein